MTTTHSPLTPARLAELQRDLADREAAAERECPTVLSACPSWCADEPGHAFGSFVEGLPGAFTFSRTHVSSTVGDVQVQQVEMLTNGAVTLGPPAVYVGVEEDWTDPQAAREHARQVLAAADLLEEICTDYREAERRALCDELRSLSSADLLALADIVERDVLHSSKDPERMRAFIMAMRRTAVPADGL